MCDYAGDLQHADCIDTRNSIQISRSAPVIVLGAACFAALSNAQGATLSRTIVPIVIFATLLQLGYLCTALLKHAVTLAHADGRRPSLGTPKLR
ncbi:hypothetical protein SAMN05443247_04293 [Bradyrhizobium erythrophlei]|nr:hypothetical protein SAMN05443247_04293 [Bradyrhizobium erythrophlei]